MNGDFSASAATRKARCTSSSSGRRIGSNLTPRLPGLKAGICRSRGRVENSRAKHPATRATLIVIVNYDDYQQNSSIECNDPCNDGCNDPCTEYKNNKNIKDNREGENGKSAKRFSPPSLEEVDSYIREKGYTVDAERFVNFYESKGWYVGKNKMKNWHAANATWQKGEKSNGIDQQEPCDKRRGTEATATRPEDYEGKF